MGKRLDDPGQVAPIRVIEGCLGRTQLGEERIQLGSREHPELGLLGPPTQEG